jgi:hypothetical protein
MKRLFLTLIATFFTANVYAATGSYVQALPNHNLRVALFPEQHSLKVVDYISMPRGSPRAIKFNLHNGLEPASVDADIKLVGNARESWMKQYSVTMRPGHDNFTISYGGEIFHPLQQEIREARSFESTVGIIAEEGVVLNGESGWYPQLEMEHGNDMLNYSLDVEMPRNWRAISQGSGGKAMEGNVSWRERQPQKEIHLIAGAFKEYDLSANGVNAMVYLRNDDLELAKRYLDASVRYIEMYQKLIAPYPYAKFALVENFWESGFGMPSFTLLGSQVIRLPFIIESSYPHEILHNWWGNSVYVDYDKGNWSEGLTAYMADHLLKEQRGTGADFRRSSLQKYADFVSSSRDFPLTKFTSRNSASSEAVGYGKAMMMFHMLRRQMDDDRYILALQNFYKVYQFKQASFADMESFFSQSAKKNFKPFFTQWTQRTGAPQLRLVSAQQEDDGDGYELIVKIEQMQSEPAYLLEVPIAITMAGDSNAYSTVISMTGKQAELHIPLKAKPLRVDIDPEFDLFRRLGEEEMPAAFSQVLGAEDMIIVLPRKAPEALRAQYLNIAKVWEQQPSHTTQIKWDDELDKLPTKSAVWLFGWENKFRGEFQNGLDVNTAKLSDEGGELGGKKLSREKDAVAIATQIGKTPIAWLAASDARMLPALARKLPHYAKYSYVAFNGEDVVESPAVQAAKPKRSWLEFPGPSGRIAETTEVAPGLRSLADINNFVKGIWPITNSPLTMAVRLVDGKTKIVSQGNLAKRSALTQ